MGKFRKFIVKHFALDYMSKKFIFFGAYVNAPRASRIIYPLMVITGLISVTNPDWPNPTFLIWILYLLLAAALFFGFVYFRFYPVKWEELDDFQKFQYGKHNANSLTIQQFKEWNVIFDKLMIKYPDIF
jgi:hypothetical protein